MGTVQCIKQTRGPEANFAHDFAITIKIQWNLFASISCPVVILQQNFAHAMTAVLSWHVQNFVANIMIRNWINGKLFWLCAQRLSIAERFVMAIYGYDVMRLTLTLTSTGWPWPDMVIWLMLWSALLWIVLSVYMISFWSKYSSFLIRICIRNCHLQNGSHFISAFMC